MLDNQKSFRTQYRKQLRLSFTNSVRKCKIRAKLPELYGLAFFRQDYSPSRRAARALVLVTVHCEYKHFSISNSFLGITLFTRNHSVTAGFLEHYNVQPRFSFNRMKGSSIAWQESYAMCSGITFSPALIQRKIGVKRC